jgi:hypothetical protein
VPLKSGPRSEPVEPTWYQSDATFEASAASCVSSACAASSNGEFGSTTINDDSFRRVRRQQQLTSGRLTMNAPDQRYLTAFHEAGHAVAVILRYTGR